MSARLVVEWTRTTVRLALSEGNGRRLRQLAAAPVETSDSAVAVLRTLLKTLKVVPLDVIGVIPRESVITRVMKFPTLQSAELAQMVELYAKAQLPYPREQLTLDFHVLARAEGFTSVAVIACQLEVIQRHLSLLREAGLSPTLLTVSSWGVLPWYQQLRRRATPPAAAEPTLIVNLDDTRTDLVLVSEGRVVSSRSVGQGLRDWAESGELATLLSFEVERSRAAVRKELPGTEVRSLILTGLGSTVPWDEQLSQRVGLPVVIVDGRAPLGEVPSPATAMSPVVVGGLALGHLTEFLNLSPPELRMQVSHRQQLKELSAVSVMLAAVFAAGAGLLTLQIHRQQRFAARIDAVVEEVEPTAKQLKEQVRSVQLVQSVLEDRRHLAGSLASIFQTTPSSVALEAVGFEQTRHEVTIRGNAATTQAVLDYLAQLERLEGVHEARLKYSTRRATPSGERTDFELVLHQKDSRS